MFLLIQLPAASLIDRLESRLPGLSVQQIDGTVFAGEARQLQLGRRTLEALRWRWRPLGLVTGKLEFYLTLSGPDVEVEAVFSIGWQRQLRLYDVSGHLPLPKAISLAGRAPPPLNGELQLAIDELLLNRHGKPQAAWGTVQLRDAHTAFGRTLELGDVALHLSTQDQVIRGDFKDAGGPLELIGFLTLDHSDTFHLNSQIGLREQGPSDLRQALNLLGRPDNDGRWRLQRSGKLTL
jgi:general secretion pathway protein N